jgi:hypothetical protein
MCKYLLQENTYLHPNPQSLMAATERTILPSIERQLEPTPIKPFRYRIDDSNDLYVLQDIPGSVHARRQAEDAAIINICLKDSSIDRIVVVDGSDKHRFNDDDDDDDDDTDDDEAILYVRVHDVKKRFE